MSSFAVTIDGVAEVERMHRYVSTLSANLQKVFELRFTHGMSLVDVGKEMGITRERVRRYEARLIRGIRDHAISEKLRKAWKNPTTNRSHIKVVK